MLIIDLNQLFVLDVVEELDFEIIFVECKVILIFFYLEVQQEVVVCILMLEFEFFVKLLEENVYCEFIWCQCVNEVVWVVMLVCVVGNDFDVIGVNYNIMCLIIILVDNLIILLILVVMEFDIDYCLCIQQVFEGLSVVGLVGVYQYYGCSVDGCVVDIFVISLFLVCVIIFVLLCENNGVVFEDLLVVVCNVLNGEDVRLVVDCVIVQFVVIVEYQINVMFYFYFGFESEFICVVVVKKLEVYIMVQYWLGCDICLFVIYVVLYVEGVQCVELVVLLVDIVFNSMQVFFCIEYCVVIGGLDE